MEYEGCINLEEGCVHYLEAYATDCLGNDGEIDNETFWVCGPSGGSDDPNVEIIFPEHNSTQNTDILEVIIHAYDDETSWGDLEVYLWIPGGRRDAPYLYYDVYPLDATNKTYIAYVPIYWYQNGAQITLEALAMDEDGNTGAAPPVTFKVSSTTIWDQWLQYGWNKLSLPFGMCSDAEGVERMLACLNHSGVYSYDGIYHYEGAGEDPEWTGYSPYLDDIYNNLWFIYGGEQYWIHCTEPEGIRYYIGLPEIEIVTPEDGETYDGLDEINGIVWSSDADIEKVEIQIYYRNESNVKYYWNGTDWSLTSEKFLCDLEPGYQQQWSWDSSGVTWIPGETFYAKAVATDEYGCLAGDVNTFTMVSYAISGTIYLNDTITLKPLDRLLIALSDEWPPTGSGPEALVDHMIITDPTLPLPYSFDVISGTYYVLGLLFNETGMDPYAGGAVFNVTMEDIMSIGPDAIVVSGADVTGQDLTLNPIPEEEP